MMNPPLYLVALVLCGVAVSCGDSHEPIAAPNRPISASIGALNDDTPVFSAWSAPVNIGEPINTAAVDQGPAVSRDGLSMYFHCLFCPGNYGEGDIWVSERPSVVAPWGAPRNLGPTVNTAANEGSPTLSRDGHRLYFNSTRQGGFGSGDIYVAHRQDKSDNLGWTTPVNLGAGVNTAADENSPEYTEDEYGTGILYFASSREGGLGAGDIYHATLLSDGLFGAAVAVAALNSSSRDSGPAIRRDGLEIYFVSERPGGVGAVDIWTSSRASIVDDWSAPVNAGSPINGAGNDAAPALSFDGRTLYFHSANRTGNIGGPFFDIWYVTRDKVKGGGD